MDVTRESSPRPNSWPPAPPELPQRGGGATQLSKAVADAVARPLIKARPVTVQDELDTDHDSAARTLVGALAGPDTQTGRAVVDTPFEPPVGASSSESRASRRPPRTDPALREQQARSLPGWLALLVLLAALAGVVLVLARAGVIPHLDGLPDLRGAAAKAGGGAEITARSIAAVSAAGLVVLATLAGLLVNAGGETRVLTRWGRYRGTVRRTGLLWVNPLLRRRRVDIRLRHWRSEPVQVADRTGTPIVVRLLIVWRVKDTARATLAIAGHEDYLREQVHAVLTRTASALPCDSNSAPGPALRDGQWFADELTRSLAAEAAPAGIEVYSVQPLALDYAPEVADSMRRRRLADLDAGLRTVLVDDAVEAAALAVRRLERATAHELDEAARSALMEQLLVAFVAPSGVAASVPSPAARAGRKEGKLA
ncbi:regulator of protease activity HflC (stomatin/prohibitin superfamily) [Kitasatospora gansuensis]|uniref:Regulator of protease activity HflC (Stomatin/prohibitin superfamily) n=1 Tax=Kitasatospora gansuensis TaxID=258050 RepID=A0A7W7WIC6_9ACTN|nr:SPFH domain-containing protein [Kitasatospora gansuensis]MBB4948121.1 regulator of protease activity HflC (stomatin/prohibitin superfamily) [Kitasatospora gansuensis]